MVKKCTDTHLFKQRMKALNSISLIRNKTKVSNNDRQIHKRSLGSTIQYTQRMCREKDILVERAKNKF